MLRSVYRWFDRTLLELGREMRLSFLPPLMVYLAAGISGLTGIVGTFFVKEYLGLSAAFLAALGFWAGIPWALKMPLGHLVDLIWRHKAHLVYLGAGLIATSLLIMVGLIAKPAEMQAIMAVESWYVLAAVLSPVGYVMQDAVADAMTVEAVPRIDEQGRPVAPERRRLMNTTMQTLGRVAIIAGSVLVGVVNVYMFQGVEELPPEAKAETYAKVYTLALLIPLISVLGVLLAGAIKRRQAQTLKARGFDRATVARMLDPATDTVAPNWWILGGSLAFVAITVTVGLSQIELGQEIIFLGSFSVIGFLMGKLLKELEPEARLTLLGTAIVIFVFRGLPLPGEGLTWWMIDALGFDQAFLAKLSLISSSLTLLGLFLFRRFMGEKSIAYIVAFLTLASFVLGLPIVAMYYGFHEWSADWTGGVVNARFIAVVNTALESPLGQVSMVPLLAWIANSAPLHLKATYFAVMASFTNLALSASQLGTKYLNQIFIVTREVRDPITNAIAVPANYSELGMLLIIVSALTLVLPFGAIGVTRLLHFRSA